jgi:periplasmic protein TonB
MSEAEVGAFVMRRRDAIEGRLHRNPHGCWPWLAAFGAALGLHAALLAWADVATLPYGRGTHLITVSVLAEGRGEAAAGTGPSPQTDPGVAPQPAVTEPLHTSPPRRRSASSPPHSRRLSVEGPRLTEPDEAFSPGIAAAGADVGLTAEIGSGAGGNTGAGSGNGRGTGDGIDERPYCTYCPAPRYPLLARTRGWQGTVHVGLSLAEDGTVQDARLRQSSGYDVLDAAAMAVARQSRFSPPTAQGLPAPLRGRIEYRFELSRSQ